MWNKHLLLLGFALLIWGCSRKGPTSPEKKEVISSNSFLEERLEPQYCTTKVKFRYQDPEQGLNGTASVRIVKDSAVWVSVSVLFGIEAARMLFLTDRMLLNNKLEGKQETFYYQNLSQSIGTNISLKAVQALLLGNSPVEANIPNKQTEQNDTIWKSYNKPQLKMALLKSNKKLTYLVTQNSQSLCELNYNSFRPASNGYLFAFLKEVSITNPKGILTVKLDHTKIDFPIEKPEMPW